MSASARKIGPSLRLFLIRLFAGMLFIAFLLWKLWPLCEDLLIKKIVSVALSRKVDLVLDSPDIYMSGFKAKALNVRALAGKLPVFIKAEDFDSHIELLPLFSGKLNQSTKFIFSSGQGIVNSTIRSSGRNLRANVSLQEADIRGLPLMQFLAFEQGRLSFLSDRIEVLSGKLKSMDFDWQLKDVAKSAKTSLMPVLTGLPFEIELPGFKQMNLVVKGKILAEVVEISKAELNSDFGLISFRGELNLKGKISSLSGKAELTTAGSELFGPYLALLSAGALSEYDNSFSFRFKTYQNGMPVFDFVPLTARIES